MNRERAKELLPIIQAFAEGKTVQARLSGGKWHGVSYPYFILLTTTFQADDYEYRIKPEPLECWVRVFDGHAGPVVSTVHETRVDALNTDDEDIYVVKFREVTDED
jgi:hypothetical protein